MTAEERAEKEARIAALRAEQEGLSRELGIEVATTGVTDEATVHEGSRSDTHANEMIVMLADALKQASAHNIPSNEAHTSSPSARGLKPPAVFQQSNHEVRRPDIFLLEIEEHAAANNNKPENVMPTYLAPALKAVYLDYVKAWEAKHGRKPAWQDARTVFMNILGHHAEHEKAKVEDDLIHNRIQQRRDQSLLTYKIYFQHMLLLIGNVPENLAVCHFLSGLGCKLLRAECQPELVANKMPTVDEAYNIARGKERMLAERGTKPFGNDLNVQGGTNSAEGATVGAVQRGLNKRGHARDELGRPLCDDCNRLRAEPEEGCDNVAFHREHLPIAGTRGGRSGSRGAHRPTGNASRHMPAGQGVSKPAFRHNRGGRRGSRRQW